MSFDPLQLVHLVPLLILAGMACVVLLAETFSRSPRRTGVAVLAFATCVAALAAIVVEASQITAPVRLFAGMLVVDRTALFLDFVAVLAALATVAIAPSYMREQDFEFGEFHALVLITTAGMVIVVHASHMATLLIGIETMSLGAYVLTGCLRRSLRSAEAALKYFLMGAFATGFLVYGIALVYTTTGGELSYAGIAAKINIAARSPFFYIGEYFLIVALGFKAAVVPFHMWAPDAYDGAPTPVAGFMAAGVKAAAFGAILRLLDSAFSHQLMVFDPRGWASILSVLAVLSMVLGNLAAIRQETVKRMLAYSSIAHAGYLLVGIVALGSGGEGARQAVLYYLLAYTITTLGAFGAVAWIASRNDERLYIDDWAGIGTARPAVAFAFTIFLLSLGGIPPTAGFFGKFYVFRSAMQVPQLTWLVIVAVLNAVVSIYYYLRVVVAMYFRDSTRPFEAPNPATTRAVLIVAAILIVVLGIFPEPVLNWTTAAAQTAAAK